MRLARGARRRSFEHGPAGPTRRRAGREPLGPRCRIRSWLEDSGRGRRAADRARWRRRFSPTGQDRSRREGLCMSDSPSTENLADAIRRRIEPLGGVEIYLPPRGSMREPPVFE
jgi:hypothetical protein